MSCIRMEKELRSDRFSPRLNVQLNTSSISCEGAHGAWTLGFSHLDAFIIINIQKASLLCNTPRWAVHVDIIVLGSGSASWSVIGYTLIVRQTRIYPGMWATGVAPIWGSIHGKRNSLSTHHFNPGDVKCASTSHDAQKVLILLVCVGKIWLSHLQCNIHMTFTFGNIQWHLYKFLNESRCWRSWLCLWMVLIFFHLHLLLFVLIVLL